VQEEKTYEAGAKLDWHSHPGGQVLLITEGAGYYQERGKPARVVRKGDAIKCAPGVEHWHGATPNSGFAYLAVTPTQKGKAIWLEPVSDKDRARQRHPPRTVQSAKYVAREMSLNASLLDVVQFKGHRFEVYGDTLSLSKKVDPQIAIEPFAFGPLLGLKNMGRLKSNGLSAKFQHHFFASLPR
jgi:Cupin domain